MERCAKGIILVSAAVLIAGCGRREVEVLVPDCVPVPGAHFARSQRLAKSATLPADRGELVVTTAAGDSSGRVLSDVVDDVVSLGAEPAAASPHVHLQRTGTPGHYSAVLAAAPAA